MGAAGEGGRAGVAAARTGAAQVKVAWEVPDLELHQRSVGHVFHVQLRGGVQEERLVRRHLVEDNALDGRLAGAALRSEHGVRAVRQATSSAPLAPHEQNTRLLLHGTKVGAAHGAVQG